MKRKTKKTLKLLALSGVCACLALSSLAGCSSNSSEESGGNPTTDNSATTPPDKPSGEGGNGAGGSSSSAPTSYSALNTYSEDTDVTGETFSSTGADENAVLVSGGSVTLTDVAISRVSSDSTGGDNSSFYGVGAALLTTGGAAYVKGGKITTDSAGGAGAFAYGDGTVYLANTIISTAQDTSGGIHAAGGGTLYAWDLTVTTEGNSSAAIRSDRGGGAMVVNGGSYTSNGTGSPAVYCTADIAVNDAVLTASNSEGVCIEGLNSLRLYDCKLTASMHDDSQNDTTWGIIIYQSMSGDSEVGKSTFSMTDGSLNVANGGVIYTTNTECDIFISDVDITYAADSEFFLQCTGNTNKRGWGTAGDNGSDCTFTAADQTMKGDVKWDSASTLDFYMTDYSELKGAFINDEAYAGNGGSGYANLYISSDSVWTVTGDSALTGLYNAGTIKDESGKTVSVIGTDGTVYVKGDSEYTVTVSSYSDGTDLSGALSATQFSDYEIALPDKLK